MPSYRVFMKVHGTAIVDVEADSLDAAIEAANDEFEGAPISICHQCSNEISDPAYGEATEAMLVEPTKGGAA